MTVESGSPLTPPVQKIPTLPSQWLLKYSSGPLSEPASRWAKSRRCAADSIRQKGLHPFAGTRPRRTLPPPPVGGKGLLSSTASARPVPPAHPWGASTDLGSLDRPGTYRSHVQWGCSRNAAKQLQSFYHSIQTGHHCPSRDASYLKFPQ